MLKDIIETHGKEEKTTPSTLDQIIGFNPYSKYGTLDEATYHKQLESMNRPELEAHARKVGTMIVQDTLRIRENCLKGFRSFIASLNKPTSKSNKIKVSDAAKKILEQGK